MSSRSPIPKPRTRDPNPQCSTGRTRSTSSQTVAQCQSGPRVTPSGHPKYPCRTAEIPPVPLPSHAVRNNSGFLGFWVGGVGPHAPAPCNSPLVTRTSSISGIEMTGPFSLTSDERRHPPDCRQVVGTPTPPSRWPCCRPGPGARRRSPPGAALGDAGAADLLLVAARHRGRLRHPGRQLLRPPLDRAAAGPS